MDGWRLSTKRRPKPNKTRYFLRGARTQERPEGLPGSIFQGSGPLTKVVQITAEQTTFWGVGAPERPEGHLGPIFHNSGPLTEMLQKEPKLRTFRGGREISRAPKCLRAFRPD